MSNIFVLKWLLYLVSNSKCGIWLIVAIVSNHYDVIILGSASTLVKVKYFIIMFEWHVALTYSAQAMRMTKYQNNAIGDNLSLLSATEICLYLARLVIVSSNRTIIEAYGHVSGFWRWRFILMPQSEGFAGEGLHIIEIEILHRYGQLRRMKYSAWRRPKGGITKWCGIRYDMWYLMMARFIPSLALMSSPSVQSNRAQRQCMSRSRRFLSFYRRPIKKAAIYRYWLNDSHREWSCIEIILCLRYW